MRLALFFIISVAGVFGIPAISQAQITVVNRTDQDLFVAIARYSTYSTVLSSDGSSSAPVTSSSVMVNGWWKVTRFGGSVNVPYATHILVSGPQGLQRITPPDSKSFPYTQQAINFSRDFGTDTDYWRSGALSRAAREQNLSMQSFAPISHFGGQGTIELTVEKLGWGGLAPKPPQFSPPTTPVQKPPQLGKPANAMWVYVGRSPKGLEMYRNTATGRVEYFPLGSRPGNGSRP